MKVITSELMAKIEELSNTNPELLSLVIASNEATQNMKPHNCDAYDSVLREAKNIVLEEFSNEYFEYNFDRMVDLINETVQSVIPYTNNDIIEMFMDYQVDYCIKMNRMDLSLSDDLSLIENLHYYIADQIKGDLYSYCEELCLQYNMMKGDSE